MLAVLYQRGQGRSSDRLVSRGCNLLTYSTMAISYNSKTSPSSPFPQLQPIVLDYQSSAFNNLGIRFTPPNPSSPACRPTVGYQKTQPWVISRTIFKGFLQSTKKSVLLQSDGEEKHGVLQKRVFIVENK